MAAAATKKNQQPAQPAAATADPKFEWAEKAGSYVLRLPLPGFRKDDFRVQVDGAGRLTVRGSRPAAAGPGSLHKVFQLPSSASLDDIAGRFEAGVLTLTVPKRASASAGGAGAAAPTSIEEIKGNQKPDVPKEEEGAKAPPSKELDEKKVPAGVAKPKEEIAKEDALKKTMDEATNKARQQKLEEEEAKSRKQEQQKTAPAPAPVKEEAVKPKTPQPAAASPPQKPDVAATTTDKAQQQKQQEEEANRRAQEQQKPASATAKEEENVKPKAAQAAAAAAPPNPESVTGADKDKAEDAPESLAEKVKRRGEEEGANAAPMAAAKRAKTDGEKKATASWGGGWKERVQGELKVLTDMKWADGMVEAARNNKEVIAIGIAAFSLGLLVSHKLFRK